MFRCNVLIKKENDEVVIQYKLVVTFSHQNRIKLDSTQLDVRARARESSFDTFSWKNSNVKSTVQNLV